MQTSTVFPTGAELDALACRLTNNSTISRGRYHARRERGC